jgi:hypothetical protein
MTHDCYGSGWFIRKRDGVGLARCGKCRKQIDLWKAIGKLAGRVATLERKTK